MYALNVSVIDHLLPVNGISQTEGFAAKVTVKRYCCYLIACGSGKRTEQTKAKCVRGLRSVIFEVSFLAIEPKSANR